MCNFTEPTKKEIEKLDKEIERLCNQYDEEEEIEKLEAEIEKLEEEILHKKHLKNFTITIANFLMKKNPHKKD